MRSNSENGFTAIELLVTLVVASMFLFSGYQLYTQVNRDGADANQAAIVSGLTRERLRQVTTTITPTCTATPETPIVENVTVTGVGNVRYTINVSCPFTDTPSLRYIKVDALYDSTKTLQHATYANNAI